MDIQDELRCLFTGQVRDVNGTAIVEVPAQEIDHGNIERGETYRVALLAAPSDESSSEVDATRPADGQHPEPPVEEGETRTVEIEDIGEQGDGIARVERGFVVIVPDTDRGERVTVEISDVKTSVAFANVVERISYYE